MLRRFAAALAVGSVGFVFAPATQASATGAGVVSAHCQSGLSSGCSVAAQASTSASGSTRSVIPQSGAACRSASGQRVPCVDPEWGWLGSDGCYYKLDTTRKPPPSLLVNASAPRGSGAYYDMNCFAGANFPGTAAGIVWLLTASTAGPQATPSVLAEQARNQFLLPVVKVELSPSGLQLVNLPTWLWISRDSFSVQSASAAVPGESVVAMATPRSVSWSMGDGSTVNCRGAGTPYAAGANPASPSPDCGYTYRRSSAAQPGSTYTVTAIVRWAVTWAGGGQRGTLPELTTEASVPVVVAESQALATN